MVQGLEFYLLEMLLSSSSLMIPKSISNSRGLYCSHSSIVLFAYSCLRGSRMAKALDTNGTSIHP